MLRAFALVTSMVLILAFLAWAMPWLVNDGGTIGILVLPFAALILVAIIWVIIKATFFKKTTHSL